MELPKNGFSPKHSKPNFWKTWGQTNPYDTRIVMSSALFEEQNSTLNWPKLENCAQTPLGKGANDVKGSLHIIIIDKKEQAVFYSWLKKPRREVHFLLKLNITNFPHQIAPMKSQFLCRAGLFDLMILRILAWSVLEKKHFTMFLLEVRRDSLHFFCFLWTTCTSITKCNNYSKCFWAFCSRPLMHVQTFPSEKTCSQW